jgi:hypothetical protein
MVSTTFTISTTTWTCTILICNYCIVGGHAILINRVLWSKNFIWCRNLSLGLATKAKGCKVAGQEGRPGVMSTPGSGRGCEGIDLHTPKGTPTLGVGVPVDSRMSRERLQGSKPNGLRISLYHWKAIET